MALNFQHFSANKEKGRGVETECKLFVRLFRTFFICYRSYFLGFSADKKRITEGERGNPRFLSFSPNWTIVFLFPGNNKS